MGSPAAAVGRQAASRVCSLRMLYLIYLRLGAEVGTISTPAGPDGNDLKSGGLAEEWLRVVAHQEESAMCAGRNRNARVSGSAL